jgi:hypothetical protein
MSFTATIRGLPHNPAVTEINTRTGPATRYDVPFKARVGLSGLPVLDVKPDETNTRFENKVYQWFLLQFPDGGRAWVRDDLLAVRGDGVRFGYDVIQDDTFAFTLTRRAVIAPGQEVLAAPAPVPAAAPTPAAAPAPAAVTPTPAPTPGGPAPAAPDVPARAPAPAALTDPNRVRQAAFNITGAFEGGGYATYQNYDSGIVSYGRFQFTLAGSGLYNVLNRYTSRSGGVIAGELRANYLERTRTHDPSLRHDARFRQLLIDAASDPLMQAAQDEAATELYWNVVQELSIIPRNIRTPLAQALIFDMGINFGPRHGFLGAAEQAIGVPPRSRLGENGGREEDLIAALARLRKQSHDRQAERDNLPGLRLRGDFWVALVNKGDWLLEGDADGTLEVTPGKRVRVRNF